MKLFSIDCHISVIADLQYIGSLCDVQIDDWSMSGHARFMGKTFKRLPCFQKGAWKKLTPKLIDEFVRYMTPYVKEYDGFIATHPFMFSLLWEKFNKPIFAVAATRYEFPFSSQNLQEKFRADEQLLRLVDSGQLHICANNRFDAQYLTRCLGLGYTPFIFPSLGAYVGSPSSKRTTVVWHKSKANRLPTWLQKAGRCFPKEYSWKDLARLMAVIYCPYQVSIMSFFEWYSLALPIVIPSDDWILRENWLARELFFDPKFACFTQEEALRLADFNWIEEYPHLLRIKSPEELFDITPQKYQETAQLMEEEQDRRIGTALFNFKKFFKLH